MTGHGWGTDLCFVTTGMHAWTLCVYNGLEYTYRYRYAYTIADSLRPHLYIYCTLQYITLETSKKEKKKPV